MIVIDKGLFGVSFVQRAVVISIVAIAIAIVVVAVIAPV